MALEFIRVEDYHKKCFSGGASMGKSPLIVHAALRLLGDPAASRSLASCK